MSIDIIANVLLIISICCLLVGAVGLLVIAYRREKELERLRMARECLEHQLQEWYE